MVTFNKFIDQSVINKSIKTILRTIIWSPHKQVYLAFHLEEKFVDMKYIVTINEEKL